MPKSTIETRPEVVAPVPSKQGTDPKGNPSAKKSQPTTVVVTGPSLPANKVVYVRHMVKPRRAFILIKDPKTYGTTSNWAVSTEFKTADGARAWAKSHKLTLAS